MFVFPWLENGMYYLKFELCWIVVDNILGYDILLWRTFVCGTFYFYHTKKTKINLFLFRIQFFLAFKIENTCFLSQFFVILILKTSQYKYICFCLKYICIRFLIIKLIFSYLYCLHWVLYLNYIVNTCQVKLFFSSYIVVIELRSRSCVFCAWYNIFLWHTGWSFDDDLIVIIISNSKMVDLSQNII